MVTWHDGSMSHRSAPRDARSGPAVEAAGARPTMKDVAAVASVSVMTVSNVINERAGTVGATTRRRVERAMAELGYHPNVSARALRSSRSETMAFLLLDESPAYLADPLTNLYLTGVGDVLRERDRGLLIHTVSPGAERERLLAPVLKSSVDGTFVLVSGEPDLRAWYVERLAALGRPFVVFDEMVDDPDVLSVRAAQRDGARMLAEYLLEQGHERIAFIGARSPWAVVEQRRLGYADALQAAGLSPDPQLQLFEAAWQPEGGAGMARKLMELDASPTAIMCASDLLGIGTLQALRERGTRVPDDVAVTGFDDFDFSAWVQPSLTTVRIPAYKMGRTAAAMVVDEVDGQPVEARQVTLPVELVVRASA